MVKCYGCGSLIEKDNVVVWDWDAMNRICLICDKCHTLPALRESYKLGFNDGLEAATKLYTQYDD